MALFAKARFLDEPELAERAAAMLKALGNPTRLRVVALLSERGEHSVGDLVAALGLPQAHVSQQLGILRLHKLVAVRRKGGFRHYSLAVSELTDLLACMTRCHLITRTTAG